MQVLWIIIALLISLVLCQPAGGNVTGGKQTEQPAEQAGPAELSQSDHRQKTYDEYDDDELLIEPDLNYLKKIKNIVIDGNNLLYYMMASEKNYEKYLMLALEFCASFKQNVFFVLKDLKNDINLQDFATGNLHIVVAQGSAKARDDYLVLHLAEQLRGPTIILTRDRYRDITNIESSEPVSYKVYGREHTKYTKLFDTGGNFPTLGKWTATNNTVGYTHLPSRQLGLWLRRSKKNSSASSKVLNLPF